MCLILFGYKASDRYDLVLAANRDEFYARPTAPMDFWESPAGFLAGKDLEQGGTWFGISRKGRFAALTNYRDPSSIKPHAPSRGQIITDFVFSNTPADQYKGHLMSDADQYNGYNLLYGTPERLFCFSNVNQTCVRVRPGIHGLSNRFLNSPWPKVKKGKQKLKQIMDDSPSYEKLFSMLEDRQNPPDNDLPDTGVGIEWERNLSPLFIETRGYGTRSSTVLMSDKKGRVEIVERSHEPGKKGVFTDRYFDFKIK